MITCVPLFGANLANFAQFRVALCLVPHEDPRFVPSEAKIMTGKVVIDF